MPKKVTQPGYEQSNNKMNVDENELKNYCDLIFSSAEKLNIIREKIIKHVKLFYSMKFGSTLCGSLNDNILELAGKIKTAHDIY